ncbi:GNAT family N-acetyltransferase [Vallitalea maricola]|uniref:GNAT family N-acetyltransferase n=1 Tax=Vallitalea maricola TaxID=3074433 RepID=A0ACB5UNK4_9FIRM|nr:GNAT family N-acetyltransferase [Vallitalea sp. AN17-2]
MIKLQEALITDAKIITEIKKEAYNDETRRFGPGRDGGPTGYDSIEENKRLIDEFDVYKILLSKQIIGCFWLKKEGQYHYELEDFCIHPKHHNKGYGKTVMILMEEMLPYIKKWTLGRPHYSVRNQHLYEKMGYKKIGEVEDGFLFLYEKHCV